MKANAIRVYNVVPPGFDEGTGRISNFLDAAWGNGKKPIYVLLSIYFDGKVLNNGDSAKSLANQYYEMDKKYASYPAVMGVTISNEIFHPPWWNRGPLVEQLQYGRRAREGGLRCRGKPEQNRDNFEPRLRGE